MPKAKRSRLDGRPPRPPNAFLLYLHDFRKLHKSEESDTGHKHHVAKQAGIAWKGEHLDVLYHYCRRAAELLEEYEKAYPSAGALLAAQSAIKEEAKLMKMSPTLDDGTATSNDAVTTQGLSPNDPCSEPHDQLIDTPSSSESDTTTSLPQTNIALASPGASALWEPHDSVMTEDVAEGPLLMPSLPPESTEENERVDIIKAVSLATPPTGHVDTLSELSPVAHDDDRVAEDTIDTMPSLLSPDADPRVFEEEEEQEEEGSASIPFIQEEMTRSSNQLANSRSSLTIDPSADPFSLRAEEEEEEEPASIPCIQEEMSRSNSQPANSRRSLTATPSAGLFSLRASTFPESESESESRPSSSRSMHQDDNALHEDVLFRIESSQFTWPMPLPRIYPGPRLSTSIPIVKSTDKGSSHHPGSSERRRTRSTAGLRNAK